MYLFFVKLFHKTYRQGQQVLLQGFDVKALTCYFAAVVVADVGVVVAVLVYFYSMQVSSTWCYLA